MSPLVWVVLAVLIAANALYVAAEFGAVGVRRSRVRRLSEDGHWLARRLLAHVDSPAALDRYVGVSQIGITLSSLMLGAYAQATISLPLAPVLARLFDLTPLTALSAAAAVVLIALTAAQLVLGELVPKAIALQYPTETALATVLPMEWSLVAFRPLNRALNGAALLLLRLVGGGHHGHQHLHSPEEIDLLIAESRDGGLLEPEEQQRLRRALRLGTRRARELMVPLEQVTMLEASAGWDDVIRTVVGSPFSRIPVYRESRDRITGSLRVKDLADRYAAEGEIRWQRLIRPVPRVDGELPADRALALLRQRRAHSAIVVEGGRAIGLLTVQDVLGDVLNVSADEPHSRDARDTQGAHA
jgi:CBS domain containing-hemolysin-like protein